MDVSRALVCQGYLPSVGAAMLPARRKIPAAKTNGNTTVQDARATRGGHSAAPSQNGLDHRIDYAKISGPG